MLVFLVTAACLLADQWLKWWVSAHIRLGGFHPLIPSVLGLTNLHNSGAAWSMLEGKQWFFIIISILALIIIAICLYRSRGHRQTTICFSLILAGALGNFIDRLRFGYVVDMFQTLFVSFPIFNVADVCLTVGIIWLIIIVLREDTDHDQQQTHPSH